MASVAAGYGLILVGVVAGLVLQEDPSWFFLPGGRGIALSLAGFATWAVAGVRRGQLPVWAGLWCGLGGLFAILGAEARLSAVIGAFWPWFAARQR